MAASKALPEGWEECSLLKYIPLVTTGVKPFNGTREYVETGDLDTGKIRGHQLVTFDSKPSRANQEVQVNDVIFAKMKDTEKVFIISKEEENYIFSTGFAILRILNLNKILPSFLYYWLRTPRFQKKKDKECTGATQKAINTTSLEKFKIVLPPLPTQRRIVSILEKAEETKRLRAQADELTDRLLQSVFLEMFGYPIKNPKGWEKVRLNDVCEKIQDGTHFSPQDQTGEVPYVTAKNIRPWGIDLTDVTYVTREFHEEIYRRCDPKKGDVIYIKDGVTAGLAKVNSLDFEFSMLSSIAMIRPKSSYLNSYYLEYYLNYPATYKRIMERKSGSAITRLILREIKDINIHLPPLPLQQKFARVVEKVESMRQSQNQSKQQIEDLFSALMQKAFKGELVA